MTIICPSPVPPPPLHVGSDLGSAIEAAQLRLSVAEKWAHASALMLKSAQSQAESSQKELQEAREYLQRMERRGGDSSCDRVDAPERKVRPDDAKAMHSLSGDTANETILSESTPVSFVEDAKATMRGVVSPYGRGDRVKGSAVAKINDNEKGPNRTGGNEVGVKAARRVSLGTTASESRSEENTVSPKSTSKTILDAISMVSDHSSCSAIEVTKCGIPEVKGKYHRFESSDGVPAYSKIDMYEGKEAIFTIGRWKSGTGTKKWCISAIVPGRSGSQTNQYAFYVAYAPSFVLAPPKKGWMVLEGGEPFLSTEFEGRGAHPVPSITHETESNNSSGNILGMQVTNSSSRQGRVSRRSSSIPRSSRKARSMSSRRRS